MSRPVLLVVEDDAALARQLRWAYEAYEVVVAGDRAAAADLLERYLAGAEEELVEALGP